ncbi:MAG TPA: KTSC domain-containing protein [Coleofasciculaceae cyanobacterium]
MALKAVMNPVRSTALKSIGYENGRLWIEFHHSGLYEYENVPEAVYRELRFHPSKGAYFDQHVRGRYPVRKIR